MGQGLGRLIGNRYRLRAEIGQGGMGTVWRAHDVVLDREVAIKEVLLPPGLSVRERSVLYQRTFREARASARLNHPGVVTVHDVVSEGDRPWIVMELVHARSLQEILDSSGPVTPRRAADIGRQVLAALAHAHKAGILHRDVKPSNVLITDEGRAVLTDFGIAQVEGDATLTETGMVMGSPAYIPPERVQGERAVPASDLWALGATLYTSVEGQAPYERPDAMAALAAALTEEVPPPRHAGPLRPVLDGLLSRSPADRMTAATALALLNEIATTAGGPSGPEPHRAAAETVLDRPDRRSDRSADSEPLETVQDPTSLQIMRPGKRAPSADDRHSAIFEQPAYRPDPSLFRTDPRPVVREPSQDGVDTRLQGGRQPAPPPFGHGQDIQRPSAPPPTGSRTMMIAIIAVIVVTVSLVAGALILRYYLTHNSGGTGTGTTGGAAGAGGAGGAGRATGLPVGYAKQKEDGFSISVPPGWVRSQDRKGIYWDNQSGTVRLQVGQTPWTVNTAAEQATALNQVFHGPPGTFPGYAKKSITSGTYQGVASADLEFTYTDAQQRKAHAVDRFFRVGGRYFAIYFRAPEKDWASSRGYLDSFYGSFVAAAG